MYENFLQILLECSLHALQTNAVSYVVRRYADLLAAVVPAEVLAFYEGIVVPNLTESVKNQVGDIETRITHLWWLVVGFVFCIVLCFAIYVGVHSIKECERWDIFRILIPPLAFIGWTMLQRPSSFDIFALDVDQHVGAVIAGGLAILLGFSTRWLARKADQKNSASVNQGTEV